MQLFLITDVKKEDGQALLEFIFFVPLMLMIYTICFSVGNALNASINQQKIARSYFYYSNQNNSTFPSPRRDGSEPSDAWSTFGFKTIIWANGLASDETPLASCFKLKLPLGTKQDDTCSEGYTGKTTQFIRVATVYGICGASYLNTNGNKVYAPNSDPNLTVSAQSCQIQ